MDFSKWNAALNVLRNGKINQLDLHSTHFSVRFPKPKKQNWLTDPDPSLKNVQFDVYPQRLPHLEEHKIRQDLAI